MQCKKYKSNISTQLVLSEIIKFLLYHILEVQQTNTSQSSLINNIEDFTYYLVASKDFTQTANILLGTFNTNWSTHKIKPIFKKIVSQKSFEALDHQEALQKLECLLEKINISAITGVDLDPIVRVNPYLRNRYFSIPELTPKVDPKNNGINSSNIVDNSINADKALKYQN
ncbi:ATPase [Nonlabens ulvanivorans]|uniref:ATPase n=1 Tax=Nonlabens ulvanivorans TaxID=906888 RepID=A0A090WGS9_NONUL|nr:ATPase [Nonlabens ulvanivorans]